MRSVGVVSLCLIVGGCGLVAQQKQREATIQAKQMLSDAIEECRRQYPDEVKQAIDKAGCMNQSMELIRFTMPYPDLLDQENAARLALAEKLQAGKVTLSEVKMQFAMLHSQLVSEEQRRSLANRSVGAQESIAAAQWRASSPVSCTRNGNTVNCY